MKMIWHFPMLDGGDDEGVNESGLWQFEGKGNRENSVTRECIQNSIDAHLDKTKPVRVVFSTFEVNRSNIPLVDNLRSVIKKASEYAAGEKRATELYGDAMKCIESDKIRILKISDYNTTGLDGGDAKEGGGRWHSLLYAIGSGNNQPGSGGAFGIGKSAPFAASMIRTVFYSTMLEDGSVAFQGKTRLSSFEDDNHIKRRGFGRYGIENNEGHVSSIRDRALIQDIFERNEQGTDIFVVGYRCADDWKKRIIEAVVKNFFVAIMRNKLEVTIQDESDAQILISTETLAEIVDRYITDEETFLYYKTMVDSKHRYFQDAIPGIGKVEMYVLVGEGRKRVQGMRKNLMKIHDFKNLRKALNDDYTGVVIVSGNEGNEKLQGLEPPAHDEWNLNLEQSNDADKEAYWAVRNWVWNNLKTIASEKKVDIEEIPELGKYLPQDMADDDRDPIFSDSGTQTTDADDTETAGERGVTIGDQDGKIGIDIKDRPTIITKPGTTGGTHKKRPKKPGKHKGGKGSGGGEPKGDTDYLDASDMLFKTKELYDASGKRIYQLTFMPTKDESGTIRIMGIGDGRNYPLDIRSAKDEFGNDLTVKDEYVKDLTFSAGQAKTITVELKSSRRYVVGVE